MISPQVAQKRSNERKRSRKKLHSFKLNYHFSWFNHSLNDVRVSAQYIYSMTDVICVLTSMLDHAQAHYQLLQMRFDAHLRHETKIE